MASRARCSSRPGRAKSVTATASAVPDELSPVRVVVDPLDRPCGGRRPLGEPDERAVPRVPLARRIGGRSTASSARAARAASPGRAAPEQPDRVPGGLAHEVHRAGASVTSSKAPGPFHSSPTSSSHARSIQAVATVVGSLILARAGGACGPVAPSNGRLTHSPSWPADAYAAHTTSRIRRPNAAPSSGERSCWRSRANDSIWARYPSSSSCARDAFGDAGEGHLGAVALEQQRRAAAPAARRRRAPTPGRPRSGCRRPASWPSLEPGGPCRSAAAPRRARRPGGRRLPRAWRAPPRARPARRAAARRRAGGRRGRTARRRPSPR